MLDRRSFLATVGSVPMVLRAFTALAQSPANRIGLQLYTVRTELEKNFERTLATVAATGYKEVEFAGYFDRTPRQIRAVLQANGLEGVSAHVGFANLGDRWTESVNAARTIGHKYLVVSSIDPASRVEPGIWERASERLNRAGEGCKAAGLQLGYHNHLYEFTRIQGTSKRPYDILLESTDPALVSMQMDLCWFIAAGQEPAAYFTRHPGRYSSVHVKDLKQRPVWKEPIPLTLTTSQLKVEPADVGQGVIDWPMTLGQCWSAGIRHYYVEHDRPESPFDSIRRSLVHINAVRFEPTAG